MQWVWGLVFTILCVTGICYQPVPPHCSAFSNSLKDASMPTWLPCMGICVGYLARSVYMKVHVCKCTVCLCVALPFSWWVAGLSRTSWPAVQGTTVPSDRRPVGDLGQRWHGHKSTDTEHVEAFRRQTHHLLPASTPPPSLPSSTAAPLLSVKCKLFPWK